MAIPHNSKCRYGERGAVAARPKAQIILDAAKVSAASGGNSEPKQGQRSQSARGFCPRSTMRVPQPDIIEHFGNADAVPQPPERCLSRQAGIVRYCHRNRKRHVLTSLRDGAHAFFFSCSLRQFSLATRQSSGGVRSPRPPSSFSRQPSHVSLPRTIFPAKVPHFPPCHRAVFNIDHIFCG